MSGESAPDRAVRCQDHEPCDACTRVQWNLVLGPATIAGVASAFVGGTLIGHHFWWGFALWAAGMIVAGAAFVLGTALRQGGTQ